MSISTYEMTIPVMDNGLDILGNYLDEVVRLAAAQDRPVQEILDAQLAPDMLTLAQQIDVLCRKTLIHAAQLAKHDRPAVDPGALSLDALRDRLSSTRAYLKTLKPDEVSEARTFDLTQPLIRGWMSGPSYVLALVLPDFFFHQTMVHAILRHLGSDVGKRFYLGHLELDFGGYD